MRWKFAAIAGLIFMVLGSMGCAHRQHIKLGDEAMERNDPRSAVESYRKAQRMRPGSKGIQNKVDRAEEEVLHDALVRIADGMAGDDADEAMVEALEAAQLIEEPQRLEMLERRAERIVLEETARRQQAGQFQGAVELIDIHVQAFGEPPAEVANRDRSVRAEWYEVLRGEGDAHLSAGRPAAAALYFGKANSVAEISEVSARGLGAVERVWRRDGLRVEVHSDVGEPALQTVLDQAFAADLPPALRDGRIGDGLGRQAVVALSVDEPRFDLWEESEIRSGEYQSGTEWVPNPDYEVAYQRVLDAEERLLAAEREVTGARRDVREAERRLREAQRAGRASSTDETRVDRAYRALDRREQQLDERSYELERRRIEKRRFERYVEQPVYEVHRYEVILQHGRLATRVEVEIAVEEVGFAAHVVFDIEELAVSEVYNAQPKLNLGSRYERPPSASQLSDGLYHQIGRGLGAFFGRAFAMYRDDLLGDAPLETEGATIEAWSRHILLDHRGRQGEVEDQLAAYTGFDDAAVLLIDLARASEQ